MKNINSEIIKNLFIGMIGILLIFLPNNKLNILYMLINMVLIIISLYQIIKAKKNKQKNIEAEIACFILTIMLILLVINFNVYINTLSIIIFIYILGIGIIKFISIFIYDSLPISKKRIVLLSIFDELIAIIFLILIHQNNHNFSYITGLYFAIQCFKNLYYYHNNKQNINIFKIPSLILSTKPYRDFLKISNKHLHNNEDKCQVEILIHVKNTRRGLFGHTDLIYNGNIYSYGNYDKNSYKILDAIGDGVMFKVARDEYIKFCKENGKTLFCFGIKYNDKELKDIDNRIKQIIKNGYKWNKKEIIPNTYVDSLNKNLDITLYKFHDKHYKNYFFLNYNCVKFIEEILNLEILDWSNITTPGMLYNYLINEQKKENSKVVYCDIY